VLFANFDPPRNIIFGEGFSLTSGATAGGPQPPRKRSSRVPDKPCVPLVSPRRRGTLSRDLTRAHATKLLSLSGAGGTRFRRVFRSTIVERELLAGHALTHVDRCRDDSIENAGELAVVVTILTRPLIEKALLVPVLADITNQWVTSLIPGEPAPDLVDFQGPECYI
jgi:hypothetical protein